MEKISNWSLTFGVGVIRRMTASVLDDYGTCYVPAGTVCTSRKTAE